MKSNIYISTGSFEIGPTMKGMGYRYWELARWLKEIKDNTILVVPDISDGWDYEGLNVITSNDFKNVDLDSSDKIIFSLEENDEVLDKILSSEAFLIFDNVLTPYESIQFQKVMDSGNKAQKEAFDTRIERTIRIISRAEFNLVGTSEEKLYVLGQLTVAGKFTLDTIKTLPDYIDVLPIPFFSEKSIGFRKQPVKYGNPDTYVWNGGLWNHYRVDFIIETFAQLNKRAEKKTIMHFMYKNNTDKYWEIYNYAKNGNEFVKIPDPDDKPITYNEKLKILDKAKGIILTNDKTTLSELVLPLRMREALLHIKPMIVSEYGLLGKYVSEYELGITINNTNEELIKAIEKLNNEAYYQKLLKNIKSFRDKFNIKNNLSLLKDYL